MKKYVKRPIPVEAIQYLSENLEEVLDFIGDFPLKYIQPENILLLCTLEGEHMVRHGDFVIKGIYGEFYPCKPDIFKDSYVEVSNESN
jgi:hypothetical protein